MAPPLTHPWFDATVGAVDVTAETLPEWMVYWFSQDTYHFCIGRAIADCYGLEYWTQPWAAHAGTLIAQWPPEARADAAWIRNWITWYVAWVDETQARIKAETGFALGEDATTPGWRKP